MQSANDIFKEFLKRREEKHKIIEKQEIKQKDENLIAFPVKQNKFESEDLSSISPIALDLLGLRR